jgi:hypothetical protein
MFSWDLQQANRAHEVVFDITKGFREVIKPVQGIVTEFHQEIARSDPRMVE